VFAKRFGLTTSRSRTAPRPRPPGSRAKALAPRQPSPAPWAVGDCQPFSGASMTVFDGEVGVQVVGAEKGDHLASGDLLDPDGQLPRSWFADRPGGFEHEVLLAVADEAALALGQKVLHDDGDQVLVEVRSCLCGPRPVYRCAVGALRQRRGGLGLLRRRALLPQRRRRRGADSRPPSSSCGSAATGTTTTGRQRPSRTHSRSSAPISAEGRSAAPRRSWGSPDEKAHRPRRGPFRSANGRKMRRNADASKRLRSGQTLCKWGKLSKRTARLRIVVSPVRVRVSPSGEVRANQPRHSRSG
jgi:hypothetical protein